MSITKPNTSEKSTLRVLETSNDKNIDAFVNITMLWLEKVFLLMIKPADKTVAKDYLFASNKGMAYAIRVHLIKSFRAGEHSKHHMVVDRSYVLSKAYTFLVYRLLFIHEFYGAKKSTFLFTNYEIDTIKECCKKYINVANPKQDTIRKLNQFVDTLERNRKNGIVLKSGRIGIDALVTRDDKYTHKDFTTRSRNQYPSVEGQKGLPFDSTINATEDCVDTDETCCEAACDAMWEETYNELFDDYRRNSKFASAYIARIAGERDKLKKLLGNLNKEHDEMIEILGTQIKELKAALKRKDVDYNKDMDAKDKELYGVYEQRKLDADRFIARIGKLIREREAAEDEILRLSKVVEGLHGHILSNTKAMANVNGNLLFRCQGKDQKPFNVSAPSVGVLMTVIKAEHWKTVETVTMHSPVYTFTKAELDFLKKR